jgi:hypothetical protein
MEGQGKSSADLSLFPSLIPARGAQKKGGRIAFCFRKYITKIYRQSENLLFCVTFPYPIVQRHGPFCPRFFGGFRITPPLQLNFFIRKNEKSKKTV